MRLPKAACYFVGNKNMFFTSYDNALAAATVFMRQQMTSLIRRFKVAFF
jgi:hypothetical protein